MVEYMENYRVGVGRPPLCKLAAVRPWLSFSGVNNLAQSTASPQLPPNPLRTNPLEGTGSWQWLTPSSKLLSPLCQAGSFLSSLNVASLSVASYFVAVYCHDPS